MLKAPALYIVATPIGNLKDISLRAIETLKGVDCIAAEDTRHSRNLLTHFTISTPIVSLHKHNEAKLSDILLNRLLLKKTIALISNAGTPLISDPGYRLVEKTRQHNIPVIPIPGPCALITALCASGLNCEHFVFEGFLSEKKTHRQKKLKALQHETRTLVLYEAPHRILDLIEDMLLTLGPERQVVLARELTKAFETIHKGKLAQIKDWLIEDKNQQRGEFVVLIKGTVHTFTPTDIETRRILTLLLKELPIKQATLLAAKITHEKKNKLYMQALELTGKTT